jgi:HTH-like domain
MLSQHYPVRRVCRVLHCARSRYYHQSRPREEALLKAAMARLAEAWPTYGNRRVTALLHREQVRVSRNHVARLMAYTISVGFQASRWQDREWCPLHIQRWTGAVGQIRAQLHSNARAIVTIPMRRTLA